MFIHLHLHHVGARDRRGFEPRRPVLRLVVNNAVNAAPLKSPLQIANDILGDPEKPRDQFDRTHIGSVSPSDMRRFIIQAINADRQQAAPDVDALVDKFMDQLPQSGSWCQTGVRVLLKNALTAFQCQGARIGQ